MAKVYLALSVITLVLCVYCLVRAIVTPDDKVRYLPKIAWILLILFFPLVGSIAWLAVGSERTPRVRPHERPAPGFPEYDRPGRAAGVTPESDDEFLKRVRERAEEQRRRAAEERATREQGESEAP